jgi:hypothetical protein
MFALNIDTKALKALTERRQRSRTVKQVENSNASQPSVSLKHKFAVATPTIR